jgi:hypothetical protein
MARFQAMLVPVALLVMASSARAQRWGGSPPAAARAHASPAEAHQLAQSSGGAWNGTASKWGGSPVQSRATVRVRGSYPGDGNAYIPVAIAIPATAPMTYAADTACAAAATEPVEMQVVTSTHEARQLTTIEVYRLQPRFQKP